MSAGAARDVGRLAGLFIPLATPFDAASGDIAVDQFEDNLRKWLDLPIDGYVLFGSNGEGALLTFAEKKQLTEVAAHTLPREYPLIVGVSAESTRDAINEIDALANSGAEFVLLSPPSYFGASLSAGALAEHYQAIADAAPIPIIVYHIPKNTHVTIEPGLMAELVKHPNIVGFKDSSGDIKRFADYSNSCGKNCRMFVGNGSLLYAALELGAAGGIVGIGQFAARACADLIKAYRAGDFARAGQIQERLIPVHKEIVGAHGAIGTKAALDLAGFHGGAPRRPLRPLGAKEQQRVAQVMQEAKLI